MNICNSCKHKMLLHGCENNIGYCLSVGKGNWCKCTIKGKRYKKKIDY